MAVQVGQAAPAFTLKDTDMKDRSLSEFKGKKVILAFYPAAFTGVCTKEMCTFRDNLGQLNSANAQVLGISTDTPFANKAFAKENGIAFPLLSDVNRDVVKAYDVVFPDLAGIKGLTSSPPLDCQDRRSRLPRLIQPAAEAGARRRPARR